MIQQRNNVDVSAHPSSPKLAPARCDNVFFEEHGHYGGEVALLSG